MTHEELASDPDVFWADRTIQAMAEGQSTEPYTAPDLDDPWHDDDDAAALIAAIREDSGLRLSAQNALPGQGSHPSPAGNDFVLVDTEPRRTAC